MSRIFLLLATFILLKANVGLGSDKEDEIKELREIVQEQARQIDQLTQMMNEYKVTLKILEEIVSAKHHTSNIEKKACPLKTGGEIKPANITIDELEQRVDDLEFALLDVTEDINDVREDVIDVSADVVRNSADILIIEENIGILSLSYPKLSIDGCPIYMYICI